MSNQLNQVESADSTQAIHPDARLDDTSSHLAAATHYLTEAGNHLAQIDPKLGLAIFNIANVCIQTADEYHKEHPEDKYIKVLEEAKLKEIMDAINIVDVELPTDPN